jgi:glycosyltransferase involved in cell wall biosynthesis
MKTCMVVYAFYETDTRVMMYAKALRERGDHVDVVALRRDSYPTHEVMNGINVYRIQKRTVNEKGKFSYLYRLLIFFIKSSFFLIKNSFWQPYDMIHVHSVPDFEVFATFVPKLFGTKIILDIHDIVPEFYASKFGAGTESFIFKSLVLVEKVSAKFADHVIIANHIWGKTLTMRSVKKEKCTTVLNYPDQSIFYRRPRTRKDNKFILIYPGTVNWHQGLDIAIKAFALIKDDAPEAEFHIYGDGPMVPIIKQLIIDLDLCDRVFLKGTVPTDQIAEVMANADLGIVPKRNDSFGGDAFSTKIFEFMSLGVPAVVSGTRIDKFYFNDSVVRFFKAGDDKDLANNMLDMIINSKLREQIAKNASRFIEEYTWDKKKGEYLSLVDSLIKIDSGPSLN